jgi:crystallin alpha B
MALSNFFPHRCGRNYWDVWDWPQSIFGQHFGLDLDDSDLLMPSMLLTTPRRQLSQRSGASEVKNDGNKFVVKLDCSHFKPEEITVKTVDNNIIINGKHEEKMDKHGWVQREFTRRYALPEGCEAEKVTSALNSNGVLTIEAPKKPLEPLKDNERVIPIAVTHESQQAINQ